MLELHPHKNYLLAQLQGSTVNGIVLHCFFWSWFQLMLMKRKVLLAHSSWFLGFFKTWHTLHCCLRSTQSCWVRFNGTRWDMIRVSSAVLVSGGGGSLDIGKTKFQSNPAWVFLELLVLDSFPFLFWMGLHCPKQNPCSIFGCLSGQLGELLHIVLLYCMPIVRGSAHTVLHVFVTSWLDYCK